MGQGNMGPTDLTGVWDEFASSSCTEYTVDPIKQAVRSMLILNGCFIIVIDSLQLGRFASSPCTGYAVDPIKQAMRSTLIPNGCFIIASDSL